MPSQGPETIDTVSKACAYGDFDRLRQFLEADRSCVGNPDEQGYFPLQWAALNNRVAEANYLITNGADVNVQDSTGQTPLHWAAVRGSLQVMETLLRNGADPTIADHRGYTMCHVAAQYGQTTLLHHCALKWLVDVDSPDADGRTPLHWAAYKGYVDTLRLLLVLDARHNLPDREGCTPLHWAAIKGNGEACTVLLQGGSTPLLGARDMTGSTPAQLAAEKGHRYLGVHLKEVMARSEDAWFGKGARFEWMAKLQLCPAIWVLILGLLAVFVFKVAPAGAAASAAVAAATPGGSAGGGRVFSAWCWTVVASSCAGLVLLHRTTTSDPGCVPCSLDGRKRVKSRIRVSKAADAGGGGGKGGGGGGGNGSRECKECGGRECGGDGCCEREMLARTDSGDGGARSVLDSPALWAGAWGQLCVSCRIVRPLRAKHCGVLGRCVEVYDHYCPWVGNTIGKGNRHYFLAFLWLQLYALLASTVLAVLALRAIIASRDLSGSRLAWCLGFLMLDASVAISVGVLAAAQASQVGRNVTTNELANWHRYRYLHGPDGSFHNPFNRGLRANCAEACAPGRAPTAPVHLSRDDDGVAFAPGTGGGGGGGGGGRHHGHGHHCF